MAESSKTKSEMALKKLSSTIIAVFCVLLLSAQVDTDVAMCIDPLFQTEVDGYLDYSVPVISVADAYVDRSDYVFLDARAYTEYATSHIPGASFIGYDDFDAKRLNNLPKETPIIVYCSIGYRSEQIGKKLKALGYKDVYNLYGSIFEWANQHHPLHDLQGTFTNRIHTYSKSWSKWISNDDMEITW